MEELLMNRTCCGCDTYHGYWFGTTCGYCGHWVKGPSCDFQEKKK